MRQIFSTWTLLIALLGVCFAHPARTEPTIKILKGEAVQGAMMVLQTQANNQVYIDDLALHISPQGLFVIGFHRDDTALQVITATDEKGVSTQLKLTPARREWDIQRIDNLPDTMVTPPQSVIARIQKDIQNVKTARAFISDYEDVLQNGFIWPVWGRISGIYGSQRILNGQPRQPHYGIDIAAPAGIAVLAAGKGRVTMAEDLYFTGGTIIIDHGYGLNSTYSHLQDMQVKKGDVVERGTPIGRVGSTGRSTGPHLDWRINWLDKRLDPLWITGPLVPASPISRPKTSP